MDFFAEQSNGKSCEGTNFASRKTCLLMPKTDRQADFRGYQLQTRKWKSRSAKPASDWKKREKSSRILSEGPFSRLASWSTRVWEAFQDRLGLFHTNWLIWKFKPANYSCWILSKWKKWNTDPVLKATGKVGGGLEIKKANSFWTISFWRPPKKKKKTQEIFFFFFPTSRQS